MPCDLVCFTGDVHQWCGFWVNLHQMWCLMLWLLSGPTRLTCWISFAPLFSFIYCWVLSFAYLLFISWFTYVLGDDARPRSANCNVSGYRCVSDCRYRGGEFETGTVPYLCGDWSWNDFYGHSPPFRWLFKKGCCQLQAKVCAQITG